MTTGTMFLLALMLLIVALILYCVAVYNSLVSLRNAIRNANGTPRMLSRMKAKIELHSARIAIPDTY